jgi:hypothetical protein
METSNFIDQYIMSWQSSSVLMVRRSADDLFRLIAVAPLDVSGQYGAFGN